MTASQSVSVQKTRPVQRGSCTGAQLAPGPPRVLTLPGPTGDRGPALSLDQEVNAMPAHTVPYPAATIQVITGRRRHWRARLTLAALAALALLAIALNVVPGL